VWEYLHNTQNISYFDYSPQYHYLICQEHCHNLFILHDFAFLATHCGNFSLVSLFL
jgi:hypothetical protein